jgi:hypothetical protein
MIEMVDEVKDPLGNFTVGAYSVTDCEPIPLPKTIPLKVQIADRDDLLRRCLNEFDMFADPELVSDVRDILGGASL